MATLRSFLVFSVFPVNFRIKSSCDMSCAFRLRRLAQNKSRGPGAPHFPCGFLQILNNSCDMSCNFDCTGLCKARNLAQTACQETSDRELVQRSCQETSYGDLVQRACQETSYTDLANRALTEILPEDLS